jgi:hypothetical protein
MATLSEQFIEEIVERGNIDISNAQIQGHSL